MMSHSRTPDNTHSTQSCLFLKLNIINRTSQTNCHSDGILIAMFLYVRGVYYVLLYQDNHRLQQKILSTTFFVIILSTCIGLGLRRKKLTHLTLKL